MNMQVFEDKNAIEREYALNLLKEFLHRVFKVLNRGDLWKEFLEHARKNNDDDWLIASSIFKSGWRLISRALYQSRAPIDITEDLTDLLMEFFTDPKNPKVTYGQIALDAVWDDQSGLECFRHLKIALENQEQISECSIYSDLPEDQIKKLEREDMLRSLIKLAMLPSKRFPESSALRDRQRWVFSEDMYRLVKKYLPESGIETDFDELKSLVLSVIPRIKSKPALLAIIDDYRADIEGEVLELVEVITEPESIIKVSVSVVVIDGKTHISGIGKKHIEFTCLGILKALADIDFSPKNIDDFEDEVKSTLFKIMEFLRGPEDKKFSFVIGLLGNYRDYLYEIEKKLSKFRGADNSKLKPAELKQKCILDSIGPVLSEIAEMMPMSFKATEKKSDGIRIQDPRDQHLS